MSVNEQPMDMDALLQENDKRHVFFLHEAQSDITYEVPMDSIDEAVKRFVPTFLAEEKEQLGKIKWMAVRAAVDTVMTFADIPMSDDPSRSNVENLTYFFLDIILRHLREITFEVSLNAVKGDPPSRIPEGHKHD